MPLNATIEQLRTAYETCGMTIEQIAQDNPDLTVESIKAALLSNSAKYRKDAGFELSTKGAEASELNFDDEQLKRANEAIIECMAEACLPDGTPDYRTRLKAATYVRDDKKGRKEVAALLRNNNQFNVFQFNDIMKQVRNVADSVKNQIVDVTTTKQVA
jgi:hypothetical protein